MLSVYSQGASAPRFLKPISREIPARKLGPAPFVALAAALVASALGGCSSTQSAVSSAFSPLASSSKQPMFPESKWGVSASRRVAGENERIPKGGGRYKVGEPYQVGGRWYNPREQPDYDRIGVASWYGSDFHGRHTANGEVFDMNALTAAHPTLPMPSYVYVTNLANDRTILVRVNDRGPYVGERMIDLSRASARELGLMSGGTGRVRVRYAGPAPLDGNDARERQHLASRSGNGGTDIAAYERDQSAREWEQYRRKAFGPQGVAQEAPPPVGVPPVAYADGAFNRNAANPSYAPRSYAAAEPQQDSRWSPSSYRAGLVAR